MASPRRKSVKWGTTPRKESLLSKLLRHKKRYEKGEVINSPLLTLKRSNKGMGRVRVITGLRRLYQLLLPHKKSKNAKGNRNFQAEKSPETNDYKIVVPKRKQFGKSPDMRSNPIVTNALNTSGERGRGGLPNKEIVKRSILLESMFAGVEDTGCKPNAKCKGQEEENNGRDGDKVACGYCKAKFASQKGRSQHMRAKHTMEYEKEKVGEAEVGEAETMWSKEQMDQLSALMAEVGGSEGFYELAAHKLDCFTKEQVQNKCRALKKVGKRAIAVTDVHLVSTERVIESPRKASVVKLTPAKVQRKLLENMRKGDEDLETHKVQYSILTLEEMETNVRRAIAEMKANTDRIKSPSPSLKNHNSRKGVKNARFKDMQEMYKNDKQKLAKFILDDLHMASCPVPKENIKKAYSNLWEKEVCYKGLAGFSSGESTGNEVFSSPISPEEVLNARRRLKNNTVAGCDDIRMEDVVMWDPKGEKLAQLFTAIWAIGKIPKMFKENRTTLIPKTNDMSKCNDISQWRPITIGSVLLRILSSILTQRMMVACPINNRQKGFTDKPECSENLMILDGIIKRSKRERKPLAVTFIDFANAFDSVAHEHLLDALQQRGADEHVINFVRDTYEGCSTTILKGTEAACNIMMKVGVKQGDPMSPILFNLAIDPLLATLEEGGEGLAVGDKKITTLAFADDLLMLSDTWGGMSHNLRILEEFCNLTGLKVQPKKCHGFMIETSGRELCINRCKSWHIDGTEIHMIKPGESERYLGVQIDPWKGISLPDLKYLCQEMLRRISASQLRPHQKVSILREYAIPRVVYMADHAMSPKQTLNEVDKMVRKAIKKWLHLPSHTTNGIIYAKHKDGGLQIKKLSRTIPAIQAHRIFKMLKSDDECTRNVAKWTLDPKRFSKLWIDAGGKVEDTPVLLQELMEEKPKWMKPCDWREEELNKWKKLPAQGDGMECFADNSASNSWLKDPHEVGFKDDHFIMGLKMRANVSPVGEVKMRGRQEIKPRCAICGEGTETFMHILCNCGRLKYTRIRRHNVICDLLAEVGEECGWEVTKEWRLRAENGRLGVPDLVFVKGNEALIVDVTIRYERNMRTLLDAAREKKMKYIPFIETVRAEIGRPVKAEVWGFPMGVRGVWYKKNGQLLRRLGAGRNRVNLLAKLFSRRTILLSYKIIKTYQELTK